jgi:hypothetical protein
MKMKRLLVYLSLIALVQVIFVQIGGKFFDEFSRIGYDVERLIMFYTAWIILFLVGVMMYLKLFSATK